MIGKVSKQMDFFDHEIFGRLPENNILVKIKKVVDFEVVARGLESYYDRDQGRPSGPIVTMLKALFLAIYFRLSDRELERQLGYNYLYRWFLDLSFYDGEPDATSLSVFRSRIGEGGAKDLFESIVSQSKEAGVLVGRVKAVDATHVEANAAKMGVMNMLRHARRKIVGILGREKPVEAQEIEGEYVDKKKSYKKATSSEITDEVEKSRGFCERVRSLCVDSCKPWLDLLSETLDKIIKKEGGRVGSFVDTDARWGYKSEEKPFFGYKVHAVTDESRIVTSVETFAGNVNEGVRLLGILEEDESKGIEAEGVTADKLYDSGDNRKGVRKLGLTPYILSRTNKRKIDRFDFDVTTGVLTCPAGVEPVGRIEQEKGWLYYFSVKDCKVCDRGDECLRKGEKRQRVYLSEAEYDRLLTGKAVTRKEAGRIRILIEPKFGEAKLWHGLGRSRWRCGWKMAIQAFITFSVINAKRLVRLIEKKEREPCPS